MKLLRIKINFIKAGINLRLQDFNARDLAHLTFPSRFEDFVVYKLTRTIRFSVFVHINKYTFDLGTTFIQFKHLSCQSKVWLGCVSSARMKRKCARQDNVCNAKRRQWTIKKKLFMHLVELFQELSEYISSGNRHLYRCQQNVYTRI